uniref:uncharacterized protein LOC122586541 n=1 Tax=Erigeron canadensis TaxID=72917 RepID=UPI001CB96FD8|nr:uncharacterized protein LOC122586541 [Erigeron canadensis]
MDADERLMELKKAYADIILNTAKEAATRIMVSEKKAVQFEYELKNSKDDAVRMLTRLKQMMDSKIREAAMTSCTQQKKIEELEAQLQEAEDIVKDLREELRAVETELGRFSQLKKLKHPVQADNTINREPITFPPSEVQPNLYVDQTNKSQRLYNSLFPLKKSLIANIDLPSIILRSKETELYRNACTQRIRACEQTTSDTKVSYSVQTNGINPKSIIKEDKVIEKDIVLEQANDMDIAADNSCLTSPSSAKHSTDTPIQENSDEGREEHMSMKRDNDDADLPLTNSETKVSETNEVPSQPLIDRVIKYTFERKRKRGALVNGSTSSERSEEDQMDNGSKVNLIGESTPEKLRLERVAHQLVSLSDKKWC